MLPRPLLISSITRPLGFRRFARRGRHVLICLPAWPPRSEGLSSSSAPLLVFSPPLMPSHLAPTKLFFLVNCPYVRVLVPELSTTLINFVDSDVQPLLSPSVESSARIVVVSAFPPTPDLHDWKWPPGLDKRPGEPYQLGTATLPRIAVSNGRRRHWDADSNKVIVPANFREEALPSVFVFQYAAAFSDPLGVCLFVLEMRPNGQEFLGQADHCQMPTACSTWLCRWIHTGGQGAAWLRTFVQETDSLFIRMEEKANYRFL